ncbi:MAG TPA: MBOAT family O-acyltransferase [Pirellulales bacterium]|jgi:D-alanyl-lipoteichoic acid acyltransferase DltB (MBOAT superfamily)|nr:MBOAT family O-acyltransferase [Pirellulales bacterium]
MLFNSLEFACFFPLVTLAYFALPHSWRWALLVAASCWFYARFVPAYILILGATIVVDYSAGILMESYPRHKQSILWASILSNVGFLFFFKYFNFVNANVSWLTNSMGLHNPVGSLDILLPIGLSFHTFQAMSYTIEVYRGAQRAERHFGIYALYVMFYPQLVAGPIERPQNMLPQFRERHYFDDRRVTAGLRLMLWGSFKKIIIADRLALPVGIYFSHPSDFQGLAPLVAAILFAFQIYCDFSGYCDIALGAAEVMGFRLMSNFDRPYFARSIGDFWRRWHISLSTWFRDYVYLPLGGSRVGHVRWVRNILIVFMLSGLWHGANWTYVVWGALHGIFLIVGRATKPLRQHVADRSGFASWPRVQAAWQILVTFLLVCVGWVFFRAGNVTEAWFICRKLVGGIWPVLRSLALHGGHSLDTGVSALFTSPGELAACFGLIAGLIVVEGLQQTATFSEWLARWPWTVRWAAYQAAIIVIVMFGSIESRQFIYFQF